MFRVITWRTKRLLLLCFVAFSLSVIGAVFVAPPAGALVKDTLETVTRPVLRLLKPGQDNRSQPEPTPSPAPAEPSNAPASSSPSRSSSSGSNNQPSTSQQSAPAPTQPPAAPVGQPAPATEVKPVTPIANDSFMQDFAPAVEPNFEPARGSSNSAVATALSAATMSTTPAKLVASSQSSYHERVFGVDWRLWFVVLTLGSVMLLRMVGGPRHEGYYKS